MNVKTHIPTNWERRRIDGLMERLVFKPSLFARFIAWVCS